MTEKQYTTTDLTLVGADHVAAYRESDGDVGFMWNGVPILLLTVRGRRSGKPRTSALIFARDGEDFLVVASMGGAPSHPNWYLNLLADPQAEVQVRDEHIRVTARTASTAEKPRMWQIVTDLWANYNVYQTRTRRDIPVVVLTPA